jgi:NitT/TauT family transport system substrate-binding protein
VLKALSALIVALSLLASSTATQAASEKIALLYAPTTGLLPSYIAKDQGFFAKHDLDVDLTLLGTQGSVISALVAGSATIGSGTPLQVIQAADSGIDVVLLNATNVSPTPTRTGLFARKGSGISKPQDLIGKKVGVPSLYTFIHVVARRWLKENGVDYNKVNFAEISFQQMADSLKGGIVDAVDCIDPYYDRVAAVGELVGEPDKTLPPGTLTSVYVSTREWATKNPDALKRFRAALSDAIAFIGDKANDKAVRDSLGRYTKQPAAIVAKTPIPRLELPISPRQVQFFLDLARDQNLTKNSLDARKLIIPYGFAGGAIRRHNRAWHQR